MFRKCFILDVTTVLVPVLAPTAEDLLIIKTLICQRQYKKANNSAQNDTVFAVTC